MTRIEGHAKVVIELDEKGNVKDSYFKVPELRGFEKFLQGRPIEEAPRITSMVCGSNAVSHHLASAKACDMALRVEPTETGILTRELMQVGEFIQSHALHFLLATPDLFGQGKGRGIFEIIEERKELARMTMEVAKLGRKITGKSGGRAVHPVSAMPGGVAKRLTKEEVDELKRDIKGNEENISNLIMIAKDQLLKKKQYIQDLDSQRTYYMGLVDDGKLSFYEGKIKIIDADGDLAQKFEASDYQKHISEHVEPWSYLKFAYYKEAGWPSGIYRVGALARTNIIADIATPLAKDEFEEYKKNTRRPAHDTMLYDWARLIELRYAIERASEILDKNLTGSEIRKPIGFKAGEGIGAVESPEGIIIHHYVANEDGIITKAKLIVATAQNNAAINRSVREVAKRRIRKGRADEAAMNDIETIIRAYGPCFSH